MGRAGREEGREEDRDGVAVIIVPGRGLTKDMESSKQTWASGYGEQSAAWQLVDIEWERTRRVH